MHPITRRNFLMEAGAAFAALSTPCVLHAGTGAAAEGTTAEVSTPLGRVRGLEKDGIRIFRGLPFGEDPYVPERRFLAPVKAKPWEGILDATKPGSIPLQPDRKTPAMIGGGNALVLNLWAPKDAKNAPVMVWIPGGGSTRCDNNDPRFDGVQISLLERRFKLKLFSSHTLTHTRDYHRRPLQSTADPRFFEQNPARGGVFVYPRDPAGRTW